MKKVAVLIFLPVAFGALFYLYISKQGQPMLSIEETTPIELGADKKELEKQIKKVLVEANHCKTNEECKTVRYGCPFGCVNLVNIGYDLKYVEEGVTHYNKGGLSCVNKCSRIPKMEEIACIDHKCVDTRYPEK